MSHPSFESLRQVGKRVARERDVAKVAQFLLEINQLLDVIQRRVADLEYHGVLTD